MINVFGEKIEEKTFLIPMQSLELKEFLGKRFQEIFQTEISNIIQPLKKYLDKGYPLSLNMLFVKVWRIPFGQVLATQLLM